MSRLVVSGLTKIYGNFAAAKDVSFEVGEGELVSLLGPSGCGKTTTLRMIAGFITPTRGSVTIGEDDVTRIAPWSRNTGMVFQNYALFPHMTVAQNVAFGLEMRRIGGAEVRERVQSALQMVRLDHLADRYPRNISGGQQQRVALARAVAIRPRVLLLDEPLSNLDAKLREQVRIEIRTLQQELKLTTIMVTHDQDEALTMSDRLILMEGGVVQQIGTPRELYNRPRSRFVADFVGQSSFIEGEVVAPGQFRSIQGALLSCPERDASGATLNTGKATLAIRPEAIRLGPAAETAPPGHAGKVEFVSYLGSRIDVHVRLATGEAVISTLRDLAEPLSVGDPCHVSWADASVTAFTA
ncbi:Fe3+/spermidine/putrescine ABC transporter ATP-binding protein [Bosea sp. Root381]|uniref:ABC transporter ATP-binding protein n=1 Tax=Bosea sp. Root381 TaxID=1736524 RepID=UPI000700A21B|nr:ABC transporter ATP-binding protein [Bosea sp. Root381]KRE07990.1 Fe3+/spermidine/putrescine ABC transporter ATP-binding protein [Bosea sp. Root381]